MAIKLNNFVDININYNTTRNANYTRDTAVLIINGPGKDNKDTDKVYSSLDTILTDFKNDDRFEPEGDLRYYVEEFFNNGGAKLRIYQKASTIGTPKYKKCIDVSFNAQTYYQKSDTTYAAKTPRDLELYKKVTETINYVSPEAFTNEKYYKMNFVKPEGGVSSEMYSEDTYYRYVSEDHTYIHDVSYSETYKDAYGTVDPEEVTPISENLYEQYSTYNPISKTNMLNIIEDLGNEYIVICSNQDHSLMQQINDTYNKPENAQDNIKGIESKLFVTCIDAETYDKDNIPSITSSYNGLIVKYGKLGSEMSIAAYLTKFNVFASNSVNDYDFTLEEINYQYTVSGNKVITVEGVLVDDDDLAKQLMVANINFNGTLVNETRAIGGNDIRGNDFVNEFMLIVLHQTLTEQLVLLLTNKIKYNSTGLSLIGATIARELQKYVNNGYLTTDKIWDDEDLVYNGITIITKNTPLKIGYKYVVMPFATLSDEDRKNHKLPTIYILIADSYSIRKIEIEGTVF